MDDLSTKSVHELWRRKALRSLKQRRKERRARLAQSINNYQHPASTRARPGTSFLDLPTELRLQIYGYAYASCRVWIISCKDRRRVPSGSVATSLSCTCRQVYQESRAIFFISSTFALDFGARPSCWLCPRGDLLSCNTRNHRGHHSSPKIFGAWLKRIGNRNVSLITKIEFHGTCSRWRFYTCGAIVAVTEQQCLVFHNEMSEWRTSWLPLDWVSRRSTQLRSIHWRYICRLVEQQYR